MQEVLQGALSEVNTWEAERFGGDRVLLRQAQACMRGSFLLAQEKVAYLDELPWLLARLQEPGVRDKCLLQWEEGAKYAGDSLTEEFLAESAPLRSDLIAMSPDGSGMSDRLWQAVDQLRQIVIGDMPGEGPHATMRHFWA